MFFAAGGAGHPLGVARAPAPLLVALHTWSGDYRQSGGEEYLQECRRRGWTLIHPEFRGPNRRPEACASERAVQDVLDAVAYAREHARVDERRIYLVGASGGGHMALVMAHRAPHLWAGVSAWVPITDLAAWHRECREAQPPRRYAQDLEAVCGGPPGTAAADAEYRRRSPLWHLAAARGVAVDLNAGIHDGHTGSVPISHTLGAFNALAAANGHGERAFTEEEIASMVRERRAPAPLARERVNEPHRRHAVLRRRTAGPARVTLFDGGHEIDVAATLDWLARQRKPDP
jgi:poly(3-hydroxybutyrate) depolymerase